MVGCFYFKIDFLLISLCQCGACASECWVLSTAPGNPGVVASRKKIKIKKKLHKQ